MAKISLRVNGKAQVVDAEPDMPLLYALRNDLELNGPKFGHCSRKSLSMPRASPVSTGRLIRS